MKIDALCEPNSISRSLKNFLIGIHIAMCSSFEVRCYYLSICADQDTFAQKAFTLLVHNGAKDFLNSHKKWPVHICIYRETLLFRFNNWYFLTMILFGAVLQSTLSICFHCRSSGYLVPKWATIYLSLIQCSFLV